MLHHVGELNQTNETPKQKQKFASGRALIGLGSSLDTGISLPFPAPGSGRKEKAAEGQGSYLPICKVFTLIRLTSPITGVDFQVKRDSLKFHLQSSFSIYNTHQSCLL